MPSRPGRATTRAASAWRRYGLPGSARLGFGLLAVLLLVTATVWRLPQAEAYQLQTGALTGTTGTNGTVVQTFPSGLTATWAASGVTTVGVLTNGMTAKAATSAMFTPGISTTQAMPTFTTDGTGCALNGTCANRGTLTLTFNRPVRNPVLHLAGLGASVTNGGQSTIAHAIGTITASSPPGATFGAVAANAVDLAVTNGNLTWDTTATSPSTSCATQTVAGQNGLAGCGSIPIVGTVTSLTLRLDMKLVTTGGTNAANPGDEYLAGVSVAEDFGDAPASYDAAGAASAVLSDLRLGASIDEDNPTTANATTGPNAVVAGANANTPNGDGADEDALTSWPTLTTAMIGSPYPVTVPISGASAAGQVCGWIDLNRNGTFDVAERACTAFGSGATSVVLTWTVPAAMSAGTTYARLRASYNTAQVQTATGRTDSGEVEDYSLSVLPTITLVKAIPGGAPGAFDLKANGTTLASAAGNGGSSGAKTLFHTSSYGAPDLTVTQNVATTAVPVTITETPTASTTATYTSTYACLNAAGTTVATGSGTSGSVSIPASTGSNGQQQSITCTFTNSAVRALALAKSVASVTDVNGNGARDAGDRVDYSLTVTDSSALTATAVVVNDPLIASVTCPATTLAPGASTTCSGSHTLTQAEVDAGSLTNTATATATETGSPVTSAPASATLAITPAGAVTLTKSVNSITDTNANSATDVGDVVRWSFLVTNTGTVTLTSVAVADPTAGTVTCPTTTLAPGASTTCTAAGHVITQAEVDSGVLSNTASAAGATPAGPTVTSPASSTTTPLAQSTTLALAKTATVTDVNGSGSTDLGDRLTWSFVVRNTGNVTLTSVAVTDPTAGAVSCPVSSLAPGASTTCTAAAHSVTQAEVDAGAVTNTATASARTPGGATVTGSSSSTTPVARSNGVRLTKSATVTDVDGDGRTDLGDRLTWTFVVTDTGTTTLTAVGVTDPTAGTVTCPVTTLAPGASTSCTAAAHVVTQADVDAGVVANTATAAATPPTGGSVTSSATANTPVAQSPALTLTKTASVTDLNGSGTTDLGDRLTWSLLVTDTGSVTLTSVAVSDPFAGTVTCPATTLAPGASTTCTTAAHTITQAEVDAGQVANTATATGRAPNGTTTSASASSTTPVDQSHGVRLVKSASVTDVDGSGHTDLGDRLTWSFLVTNIGTSTLSGLAVTDPSAGTVSCPVGTLAPGASTTCTAAAHVITQADVNAGVVSNTATATATTPGGSTAVSPSTSDTPVSQQTALRLTKAAAVTDVDGNGSTDLGDRVTWTLVARNTGTVTLTALAISDPVAGTVSCPTTTLPPGASTTCTVAAHTITQADVDNGLVANTATATATTPGGAAVGDTAATSTPVTQSSGVRLVKTAAVTDVDGSGHTDLGDTVTWAFAVTNTGTTTLTAVGVTDPTAGTVGCPTTTLAPGASTTCTAAAHVITQADVDAGLVSNTATATATTPAGTATTGSSTTDTPVTQSSTLALVKSAAVTDVDADGSTNKGDRITWSFLVTNTGSVTVGALAVTDPLAGAVSCPATTLAPGASTTCTAAAHTVTQADVDAGLVTNTATAAATAPNGSTLGSAPSSTTTSIAQLRGLAMVKSAAVTDTTADGRTDQGDSITWSFAVTNTGTVTVDVLTVTDPTAGAVSCPVTTLAPATSTTCTAAAHRITQADVDAGVVTNTALAQGQAPAGGPVVSQTSRTDTPVAQTAALSLAKSAAVTDVDSSGTTDLGDTIDWSFVVANTGTTTLTGVAVTDPTAGAVSCPVATLAPGAATLCTAATHVITQPDVDAGLVSNTATATATSSLGQPVSGGPASTDTPVAQNTGLTLAKSAAVTDVTGNGTDLGDSIAWSFVVTNTGTVTLTSVAVADPKAGAVSCPTTTLTPGASTTCTATAQTITQTDVDSGVIANIATASGVTPTSTTLTTSPASTSTGVQQVRGLRLTKSAALTDVNGNGIGDLGDTVAWTFLVTNTGTVTAGNLGVSDPTAGAVSCPVATLAPGASTTCTAAAHTVTQAEVDAGTVSNTATAHGQTPVGGPVTSSTSSSDTSLTQVAALTLVKSAAVTDVDGDGRTDLGDRLTWSFALHNTGTTTLTGVGVTDPTAGTVSCPVATLTPGASTTCTAASHVIAQADVDAGTVTNTATGWGTTPSGSTLSTSPSSTTTAVQQLRGLRLVKAAVVTDVDGDGVTDLGDTITWSFLVTNTGTVSAGNVGVNDPTAGAVTCPVATLAPGASTTCTAAPHTITQPEVDAGVVSNTATTVGQTPTGGPVTTSSSTTDTPVTQASTLALTKSATVTDVDGDGATDLGDTVTWSFLVHNSGSVTLTSTAVTDPIAGAVTCPTTTLAPAASTTCTAASHLITQADVDAGIVANLASATAVDPTGTVVTSNSSTTNTPVLQTHGIRLAKSATTADLDGNGLTGLGDTITWSFGVTNIGNVTVDDLAVTDATAGAVSCPVATLPPGASTTCTAAAHTVGQTDVDAGVVSNTATATGQAPHGAMAVQSSSSTDTPVNRASALTLVKSAAVTDVNGNGHTDLGDRITWTFTVTDTGTTGLSGLAVADPTAGTVTCPTSTLAPGAVTTCTAATHTITQADVDAGVVSNSATASATDPGGAIVGTSPSFTDTPVTQTRGLALTKTATLNDLDGNGPDLGDTLGWSFLVRNTGTVSVAVLVVTDPMAGPLTCPTTTLAPGASATCTAVSSYAVTQADVDAGVVSNTATVTGEAPAGGPAVSASSSVDTPVGQSGGLSLVKSAAVTDVDGDGATDLGDTIAWSFAVTNTGTTTLSALAVTDPVAGAVTCPVTTLTPGASTTCTADTDHVVTQADVDAGSVVNSATVAGTDPGGATRTSGTSTVVTPVARQSGLTLVKSASVTDLNGNGATDLGDEVVWSFVVTNSGTVAVSALAVTDPVAGTVSCPSPTLAPGASTTCTAAPHTVTQTDVDAGVVSNTATATGALPGGSPVASTPSTVDTPVARSTALHLVKTGAAGDVNHDGATDVGDTVTWTFQVTNTGTTTVTHLTVSDPTAGAVTCAATSLAPGAATTCRSTLKHTVTAADVASGTVRNTAVAQGSVPGSGSGSGSGSGGGSATSVSNASTVVVRVVPRPTPSPSGTPAPAPSPSPTATRPGHLPYTGAVALPAALALAGSLLVTGLLLVGLGRRGRRTARHL